MKILLSLSISPINTDRILKPANLGHSPASSPGCSNLRTSPLRLGGHSLTGSLTHSLAPDGSRRPASGIGVRGVSGLGARKAASDTQRARGPSGVCTGCGVPPAAGSEPPAAQAVRRRRRSRQVGVEPLLHRRSLSSLSTPLEVSGGWIRRRRRLHRLSPHQIDPT